MSDKPNPNNEDKVSENDYIEPTLQFCVFCDVVAQGPGNKPTFIGVFDQFLLPGPIPQFFIALRWINGLGRHTSTIRLLDPELNPIYTPPEEQVINLTHRTNASNTNYGIVNFRFPTSGVYWVEVILNRETYTSIPLPVFGG